MPRTAVLNRIGAFIHRVESLVADSVLSEDKGGELIDAVQDLLISLMNDSA